MSLRPLRLLLAVFFVALAPRAEAQEGRKWTVMVYMNGDNNLEEHLLDDAHEIRAAEHSASVKVVFQLDRHPDHDDRDGDWTQTLRFEDRFNGQYVRFASPATEIPWPRDTKEINMGAPESLTDFIRWAREAYPAEHYALILAGHGQGARVDSAVLQTNPRTFGPDETVSRYDYLYVREAHEAIRKGLGEGNRLDVLGFDSCLMATVEVAYAFRDVARYMVASKAKEPGDGWDYTDWLGRFEQAASVTNRSDPAEVLARHLVDSYRRKRVCDGIANCQRKDHTTLSAVNLDATEGLVSVLGNLATKLTNAEADAWKGIASARAKSRRYSGYFSVDLKGFLTLLSNDSPFKAEANQVLTALSVATAASFSSYDEDSEEDLRGSGKGGLSIYFPAHQHEYMSDANRTGYTRTNTCHPMPFVQSQYGALWVDFVHEFFRHVQCTSGRCPRPVTELDACAAP